MEIVSQLFPLVLTSNLAMSAVKWLADGSIGRPGLRFFLIAISLAGVITTASVTGQPVNFDSLTGLSSMLLETLIVSLGAHFSYKAIKNA